MNSSPDVLMRPVFEVRVLSVDESSFGVDVSQQVVLGQLLMLLDLLKH